MIKKLHRKLYHFLRRTQKYTKTDNVYLVKYGSWLIMAQIISSISAFLLALAFANLLPKEIYGIYKYVLSMASLLAIPTLAGIDIAITQAVSRGYEGSFTKGLKTKFVWGSLGSLVSLGLTSYYYFNDNTALTISFLMVAAFLPLMDTFNLYTAILGGRKKFNIQAKYTSAIRILSVVAIVITIFLTNNLFLILLVYFFSYTFWRFVFLIITLKKFLPNKKEDSRTIAYGKHLTLIRVISTIANYLDSILVFNFLGAAELAIYSFAIIPPDQIKALLKSIEALAMPKFSIRTPGEIKTAILPKMLKLALPIALAVVIYIVLAPFLYGIFFPQYSQSVLYSQIFSISLIAAIATLPYTALQAKMAKKQLYQYNIYSPAIQITLLLLLIYFYGLWGVILARVISRFVNLFITYWLIRKI